MNNNQCFRESSRKLSNFKLCGGSARARDSIRAGSTASHQCFHTATADRAAIDRANARSRRPGGAKLRRAALSGAPRRIDHPSVAFAFQCPTYLSRSHPGHDLPEVSLSPGGGPHHHNDSSPIRQALAEKPPIELIISESGTGGNRDPEYRDRSAGWLLAHRFESMSPLDPRAAFPNGLAPRPV